MVDPYGLFGVADLPTLPQGVVNASAGLGDALFSAREYKPELAELLLRNGAEVDAQDVHGNTPLFRALFYSQGRGEIIKLLIAHSANKALKNQHGMSPQDLVHSIGNYDVWKFLE